MVYAKYGTPDNFDQLLSMGVEVTGNIVLARFGNVFRGNIVRRIHR